MKKPRSIFYAILFGLLMVFLFSFMIQEHFKPFKTKELMGYFLKPEKPKFRWEWYKDGYFQKSIEKYITNNYGFREPIIRLYHQYCWDFFGKEYVSYIYPGKERWLYYGHNIEDYYSTEMYHWYPDADAARKGYEQEVRLMNKVKGILDDYDVTLMTFIAPSKSIVYPEYLPRQEHDTTSLNAREYFIQRFGETGMPCFDMTEYFLRMKDTCSFYLFPPTGDHWNFSCVYATDSLLRFMERQRDIRMPRIEYGNEYHTECRIGDDQNRDLEGELNLLRPIKFDPKFEYKERDYWLTSDSTTVKPAALFIGNSFLLRTMAYIPPKEVFSDFQFGITTASPMRMPIKSSTASPTSAASIISLMLTTSFGSQAAARCTAPPKASPKTPSSSFASAKSVFANGETKWPTASSYSPVKWRR